MQIVQQLIPTGRRNRPGRWNPANYITIHNTGNPNYGADALAHAAFLRGDTANNLPVSWHYTIDNFRAVQHLPENEDAFHASDGAGLGNRQSIGLEICMNRGGNLLQATNNAAMLAAQIMRRNNFGTNQIRQHNHWDPRSQNCPSELRAGRPYNWQTFLNRVAAFAASGGTENPTAILPYTIRITVEALNIRLNPSILSPITGVIRDRLLYTIVEESDGFGASRWGRLRSGIGWIALDWVQRAS